MCTVFSRCPYPEMSRASESRPETPPRAGSLGQEHLLMNKHFKEFKKVKVMNFYKS